MKVITEAALRAQLRNTEPTVYYVEEGKILSPAAREYLQQRKIKIEKAGQSEPSADQKSSKTITQSPLNESDTLLHKFVDYETGAYYTEKPEHMTHLHGNHLVAKNHPRIVFRGKLDSLQGLIVLDQTILAEQEGSKKLIEDLSEILGLLREIMRCEVLEEALNNEKILGLTHSELREQSHNPLKYFHVEAMKLPDYTLGRTYALLNQLRTSLRELEVAATEAFQVGNKCSRKDIIQVLNRLSSALHIIMCRHLSGMYR